MSRGKRYDGQPKLNKKKVVATIFVIAVLIMIIVLMLRIPKVDVAKGKNVANSYITVYTNDKWGVINSKGEIVVDAKYDNMIIIPDSTKNIFICQEDVDAENENYRSFAINDKGEKLYSTYEQVEAMQNIDENGTIFYDTNVLKVEKDGKFGLINFNGKELIAPQYDSITPLEKVSKSFVTELNGKKGLVDNAGSVIIENLYAEILPLTNKYEDGYIVKNEDGLYGLINYNKKQILECKYTKIMNVCGSDMYVVKEGEDIKLVTADGKTKLLNSFSEAISIDNSNIIVKDNGKYGVISAEGDIIIPQEYEELKYAFDGNYIAKKDNKYGIINTSGQTQVDFKYDFISYMDEGFIEAEKEDGETDILDTLFQVKTSGIVSTIDTKLGYIKVREDGEYKYFNFKLEEKDIKDVLSANTLYLSKKGDKYGFVDSDGNVVVNYIYDDATEQNDYGYAAIKKNGKWGAIDTTGKVVVEPKYEFSQNTVISFIGKWHLAPDLNANYYTDIIE